VEVGNFHDEVDFVVCVLLLDFDQFEDVFPVDFLFGEIFLKKHMREFVEEMVFFMV
jgi:hypothetical protein